MSERVIAIDGRKYRRNPDCDLGWEYYHERLGRWREVLWDGRRWMLDVLTAVFDLREKAVPKWGGDWFKDVNTALAEAGVEEGEADAN